MTLPLTSLQLVDGQSVQPDVGKSHATVGEEKSISMHSSIAPGQLPGDEHTGVAAVVKWILLIPPPSTWTSKALPCDVSPW